MGEKIPVQLKDVHDVNEFVNILPGFEGDFDLYCGRCQIHSWDYDNGPAQSVVSDRQLRTF